MSTLGFKSVVLLILLFRTSPFPQSGKPLARAQSPNVHGTARLPSENILSAAQVVFNGDKISKTVFTDKTGFYKADLPAGLYTMIAMAPKPGFKEYRRPLFRVASSTNLTLDIAFVPGVSCDLVVPNGGDHTPTQDQAQDACGGLEFFRVPSEDGVPFELSIDYPGRRRADQETVYGSSDQLMKPPVLVAYNLFTLRADAVVYDVQSRILKATGNVLAIDEKGAAQHADSMTFRIGNGQATPLH
jgi:hypothetical protein